MFKFHPLSIGGAFEIECHRMSDARGDFCKRWQQEAFAENGLDARFTESYHSVSNKDVIRGMHFQKPPFDHAKLVYCLTGSVEDVLLDIRKNSPTYGQSCTLMLSERNPTSLYLPRGVAHGFKSLQDNSLLIYSVTSSYKQQADTGILWSSIPHDWKLSNAVTSERDKSFPTWKEFKTPFTEGL